MKLENLIGCRIHGNIYENFSADSIVLIDTHFQDCQFNNITIKKIFNWNSTFNYCQFSNCNLRTLFRSDFEINEMIDVLKTNGFQSNYKMIHSILNGDLNKAILYKNSENKFIRELCIWTLKNIK